MKARDDLLGRSTVTRQGTKVEARGSKKHLCIGIIKINRQIQYLTTSREAIARQDFYF